MGKYIRNPRAYARAIKRNAFRRRRKFRRRY